MQPQATGNQPKGSIQMKKIAVIVVGAAVAAGLTLPGAAAAGPTWADRFEARKTCISERGVGDPVKRREFRLLYGRRPMRKCVRYHARLIAMERRAEAPLIRAECRMEQIADPIEFRQEFPGGVDMCVRLESMP
jgi:hypothetical protein